MKTEELYKEVTDYLKIDKIHPLHKALLEQCCESGINAKEQITNKEDLLKAVLLAFSISNTMLQSTLKAGLTVADNITLNYRDQTFTIDANSNLLGK